MGDPLGTEKEYLKANRDQFMQEYPGKYLLIKDEEVFGAFETYEEGVKEGARRFGVGPFLVRSVLQPEDAEAPSIPALSIGVPFSANSQHTSPRE